MQKQIAIPLLFGLLFCGFATAQVKIGDNPQTIDPTSVLELESSERVLVITRVDSTQMASIVPNRGALVYNTSADCMFYYNGTAWVSLCSGAGSVGGFTTDAIINDVPTIEITPTPTGGNIEIARNSISSRMIVDGGVNGVDIQDGSIGRGKLQNNSVDQSALAENSVGPFAIDNDNIDLGDFNNAAGFIRLADVVSGDDGNAIISGGDGGAFYDDSDLRDAVETNTLANTADEDSNPINEIQELVISGNQLSLSLGGGTVTIPTADGSDTNINAGDNVTISGDGTAGDPYVINAADEEDGSDTNEIITAAVLNADNELVISEAGTDTTVDLSSLAGGGGDGGGGTINPTAAQVSVAADPGNYTETSADVEGHLAGIDAALANGGGGGGLTSVSVNESTLSGDGADEPLDIENGGIVTDMIEGAAITPGKIEPGEADQILRTNAAGDGVDWVNFPTGTGGNQNLSAVLGEGNDGGAALIKNIGNPEDDQDAATKGYVDGAIASGGVPLTAGSILIGDATGAAQPVQIGGDATLGNTGELTIASEAVNSDKIANATIGLIDFSQMGAEDGEILKWNNTQGAWEPATDNTGSTAFVGGDGLTLADGVFSANVDGTTLEIETDALQIKDEGVNSAKITNTTIALEDLSDMGATTTGQIMKWDGTAWALASDETGTGGNVTDTDANDGLTNFNTNTGYDLNVDDTTVELFSDALQIKDGGVNSAKIANTTITLEDLSDMGATASGQIMKWDGTAWALASDETGTGGNVTDTDANDGLTNFNTNTGYDLNVDDTTVELFSDALQIKDGGVNSAKIANTTIALEDLSDMGATASGQIMKWDGTAWALASDETGTGGNVTDTDANDGLTNFNTNTGYDLNVDDTTVELFSDALQIRDGGVNSAKIANTTIALEDLSDMGATASGQIMKWDGTAWALASDETGTGGNVTDTDANDGLTNFNTNTGYDLNVDGTTVELFSDALQIRDGGVTNAKLNKANIPLSGFGAATADLDLGGFKIINLGVPTLDQDAATKKYVDDNTSGVTGTTGSIFFADADGSATENNSELFWDNENDRLGIGVGDEPSNSIHTNGSIRVQQGFRGNEGTTLAPTYAFHNDPNSGMWRGPNVGFLNFSTDEIPAMTIDPSQNIGIGLNFFRQSVDDILAKLHVVGDILAEDNIRTEGDFIAGGTTLDVPDYVFQKFFLGTSELKTEYEFKNLNEIETFIKKHHHLPGIKSAAEVKKDGFWNLSASNLQNLEKIEELYLHTIEQEKKIDTLQSEKEALSEEVKALREDLDEIKAMLKKSK